MRSRRQLILFVLIFQFFELKIGHTQSIKFEKIELPKKVASLKIHKVFTDNLGNLFIANDKGIVKWNGFSFEEISKLKNFNDYSAYNIWQDNKGLIWINTFGEKMICYNNDIIVNNQFSSVFKDNKINSSVQDINGNYWFGNRYGRIILIDKYGRVKMNENPSEEIIHRIHRIEPMKNGNVIAALVYGSFYVLNPKCEIVKKLDWKHDYNWGPGNMFCLKNGKLIFCNNEGIHLYSDRFILEKSIHFDNEFKGYISDIKEDIDGTLWVGSKSGLYKLRGGIFEKKNVKLLLKDNYVNSLSFGIENILWVATNNNGLLKINKKDVQLFKKINQETEALQLISIDTIKRYNITKAFLDNKTKTIWWAGNRIFGKISGNINKNFWYDKKIFLNPQSITLDASSHLWISGGSLIVFDLLNEKQHVFSKLNLSNVQDCKFIYPYIFVATRSEGIFILKNGEILKKLDIENGLFSNNCSKIIPSKNGVFLIIDGRVFKYEFEELKVKKISVLDHDFNNINVVDISEENNIFRCFTKDSFCDVNVLNYSYPVKIGLVSNGLLLNPGKKYRINYGNNETRISFVSATFNNQDLLFFRYKIIKDGVGSKWTTTSQNNINLIGLEPGNYQFVLENSCNKFNWYRCRPIQFVIVPPYWKTTWFKTAIGIAIILLLTFFFLDKIKAEKNKRLSAEIKLKALQSQMNPHFIFNSLNAIQQFIFSNDVTKSNHYLSRFASLMRKCYEYANLKFISIEDEIGFLENYLEIETMRFDDKFKFKIEVSPTVEVYNKIPPLLIQPIVENAIKHGFKKLREGGVISIKFEEYNSLLKVTIIDNGIGDNQGRDINMKGSLQRLQERFLLLKRTFKNRLIALNYRSELGKGTEVELIIPIIK